MYSNTRFLTQLIALLFPLTLIAQTYPLGLIPQPAQTTFHQGHFTLPQHISVSTATPMFDFACQQLINRLSTDLSLTAQRSTSTKATIAFDTLTDLPSSEAYRLTISKEGIRISATHPRGALYGVMTLAQLMYSHRPTGTNRHLILPHLTISDSPRFAMRALLLDPARHFLPVDDVKAFIDRMSYYKFNTLHLHLTDDQGWRIEIPHHPKLTEASKKYYTSTQLKELVAYATDRGIDIIPEIDVPGHTAALLIAYPDLRCEFLRDSTFVLGKTDNVMLSAANERTYSVLDDVLRHVSHIFPQGTRIHLGGDESAIERNWALSAEHRALMTREGLKTPRELMGYFFNRVLNSARRYGLRPMLWSELDNVRLPANEYLFDYPQDVELISWRWGLTPKCIELSRKHGHRLLLAPGEQAYLDYPQYKGDLPEHNNWGMPVTPLKRSYCFDLDAHLYAEGDAHIIGILGTLWAEAIPDLNRAFYMAYPRALALSEVGWTPLAQRDWERFRLALPPVLEQLMRTGVAFRTPGEIYRTETKH